MGEHVTMYSDQDLRLMLVQTIVGEGRAAEEPADAIVAKAKILEAYVKGEADKCE
jgi:hypothetical protein